MFFIVNQQTGGVGNNPESTFGNDLVGDVAQAICKVLGSLGGIDNQGILLVRVGQGQDRRNASMAWGGS